MGWSEQVAKKWPSEKSLRLQRLGFLQRKLLENKMLSSSVPGGIRTPNLLIRSQKLYPVELQAQDRR